MLTSFLGYPRLPTDVIILPTITHAQVYFHKKSGVYTPLIHSFPTVFYLSTYVVLSPCLWTLQAGYRCVAHPAAVLDLHTGNFIVVFV